MVALTLLRRRRTKLVSAFVTIACLMGALLVSEPSRADAVSVVSSGVRGSDGKTYTVTNHLTSAAFRGGPREWLLVWAGPADTTKQDFMAVIDATKSSRTYGRVVNTVTFAPRTGNEPHHTQYLWHKGDRIYASGILSDTVFVLDSTELPALRITGVNLPADTPCGSAPDASWVLSDGTAYTSYMGGPHVAGPCKYTDGQARTGNGEDGSPGEIVRVGKNGQTLSQTPAATKAGENPNLCHNNPVLKLATCANPHGIAVRQDLNRMVTADYTEIKDNLTPGLALDPLWLRNTVRIWNIRNLDKPKLLSVSYLPVGPRPATQGPAFQENRMVMEAAVTNRPQHQGAFVSTMAGGAIYYTPNITGRHPVWREIVDDTYAYRAFDKTGVLGGTNDGGSWLQVSPDDKFLFHTVMGANWELPRSSQTGMVFVLNIQKLLASGNTPKCRITTLQEVYTGGTASDCPALTGVVPIKDASSDGIGVGPHWGAMDNFTRVSRHLYTETTHIRRMATANYFLSEAGLDGDHRVCMFNLTSTGKLSLDTTFRDQNTGDVCVSFNRKDWPQGNAGDAHPHGVLFVVSNRVLR